MKKPDFVFFDTISFGRYMMLQLASELVDTLSKLPQDDFGLVMAYTGPGNSYADDEMSFSVIDSIRIDNYNRQTENTALLHALTNTTFNLIEPDEKVNGMPCVALRIRNHATSSDFTIYIWSAHNKLKNRDEFYHSIDVNKSGDENSDVFEWYQNWMRKHIKNIMDHACFGHWSDDDTISITDVNTVEDETDHEEKEDQNE